MARLVFYAAAREAAGCNEFEAPGSSVAEVLAAATRTLPEALGGVLAHCTFAVDGTILPGPQARALPATAATEISVLPPVSGGDHAPAAAGASPAAVRMVDVGDKAETRREASAECRLVGEPEVLARILAGDLKKGDAPSAARIAGVMAAKRVPELIPLCHPVRTSKAEVTVESEGDAGAGAPAAILVRATVGGVDRTGFEMEALTAASIAALTMYDMAKSEDPGMRVDGLRITAKSGGKSGTWTAP
jgi:cyclic pyranopterin monophosphate synthase